MRKLKVLVEDYSRIEDAVDTFQKVYKVNILECRIVPVSLPSSSISSPKVAVSIIYE